MGSQNVIVPFPIKNHVCAVLRFCLRQSRRLLACEPQQIDPEKGMRFSALAARHVEYGMELLQTFRVIPP